VAAHEPARLAELRAHLDPIRPTRPDPFEHIAAYEAVEDKGPYIEHAHAAYSIVDSIAPDNAGHEHAVALHNARQVVSLYENYSLPLTKNVVYREARAAENLRWWRDLTGDRIVYWAASAHTANAPDLRIVQPPGPELRFPSTGSYLRQWYGRDYLSIGFTLDHGSVGSDEPITLPPPRAEWFEHPLGHVEHDQFSLDLRASAPPPVQRWLHGPVTTRGLPDAGPESFIDGGSLHEWFDVLVHHQAVTPASSLTATRSR
jgi:erythromycin esterase